MFLYNFFGLFEAFDVRVISYPLHSNSMTSGKWMNSEWRRKWLVL